MEVILLERIEKLGQMGEVVNVKNGFARNYLLPLRKALRATKANIAGFENQRSQYEAQNIELRHEADGVAGKLDGLELVVIRQASESGQLYGSVAARDISAGVTEAGFTIERRQVEIPGPIKSLGIHKIRIVLHPEVFVTVSVNVARTEAEAITQAAGRDVAGNESSQDERPDSEPKALAAVVESNPAVADEPAPESA